MCARGYRATGKFDPLGYPAKPHPTVAHGLCLNESAGQHGHMCTHRLQERRIYRIHIGFLMGELNAESRPRWILVASVQRPTAQTRTLSGSAKWPDMPLSTPHSHGQHSRFVSTIADRAYPDSVWMPGVGQDS